MKPGTCQTWKPVQHINEIRTKTRQRISAVHWVEVFVFAYLYLIIRMFVSVKDRATLRIAIRAHSFYIFGLIFGFMFCLLIINLILRSKTIWKSMRNFPCVYWSVRTFPDMDKEEIFFSWKLHMCMLWIFLDYYLSIRPENQVKNKCRTLATNFSGRKCIEFCCVQMIYTTIWPLITCNMPQG